jgi:hypothetical protein
MTIRCDRTRLQRENEHSHRDLRGAKSNAVSGKKIEHIGSTFFNRVY